MSGQGISDYKSPIQPELLINFVSDDTTSIESLRGEPIRWI